MPLSQAQTKVRKISGVILLLRTNTSISINDAMTAISKLVTRTVFNLISGINSPLIPRAANPTILLKVELTVIIVLIRSSEMYNEYNTSYKY